MKPTTISKSGLLAGLALSLLILSTQVHFAAQPGQQAGEAAAGQRGPGQGAIASLPPVEHPT